MEEKRIVKPWQAGLMLLAGIAVIIVGLLVMKLNNRIVLALDGVIMCHSSASVSHLWRE